MNVTGNETTADNVTNTWENASLYYSMPSDDPDLLGCQPIILKTELQVCIIIAQIQISTLSKLKFYTCLPGH